MKSILHSWDATSAPDAYPAAGRQYDPQSDSRADMRRKQPAPSWVVDYSAARAHAIRWLGDRYLLARPINARQHGSRPPTPGIGPAAPAVRAGPPQPATTNEAFPLAAPAR